MSTASPSRSDTGEPYAGHDTISITDDFERFDQSNDMFCRGFWDQRISNKMTRAFFRSFVKPGERMREEEGFKQRDYALRNGPWVVTEMLAEMRKDKDQRDGFWDEFSVHIEPRVEPLPIDDPGQAAEEIKRVTRVYGADLVGITAFDERLSYKSGFSARGGAPSCKLKETPEGLDNVIVFAKSMDYELVRTSPSSTAATAPAIGYAHDATILLALAQYIRSLGYRALASQNDSSLAVPYALAAGLGEYGRNGLLITKDYGPRVRLGRVLTDMPLAHDKPIRFGVSETCKICRRCANNCPPQAIDHGEPSTYRFNISNIKGVRKWTTDAEKCFKFWVSKGSDCANCIRSCPYNKDFSKWWARLIRFALGTPLRKLALQLDDRLRLHDQLSPSRWWGLEADSKDIEPAADHALDPERVKQQERVKRIRDAKRAEKGEAVSH